MLQVILEQGLLAIARVRDHLLALLGREANSELQTLQR
jgi:hypothetical protein